MKDGIDPIQSHTHTSPQTNNPTNHQQPNSHAARASVTAGAAVVVAAAAAKSRLGLLPLAVVVAARAKQRWKAEAKGLAMASTVSGISSRGRR